MKTEINSYKWYLFLVFVLSCSSGKNLSRDIEMICQSELGGEYLQKCSPDNTYILCLQEKKGEQSRNFSSVKYIVINTKTGKLMYRGTVIQGKVEWKSDKKLLIHEKIGILDQKNQNDRIYVVNVEDGHITQIDQKEKL